MGCCYLKFDWFFKPVNEQLDLWTQLIRLLKVRTTVLKILLERKGPLRMLLIVETLTAACVCLSSR